MRCLIAYFASTGARKADVALDNGVTFGLRHLSLWNATWEINGHVVLQPTAEDLRGLNERCFVHLTSVPCKNDPDGSKFAGTPTTCRFHPTAPINFARELAAYEVMRGTSSMDRRRSPLLLAPGGNPWRKGALDSFFKLLLRVVVSEEVAKSLLTRFTPFVSTSRVHYMLRARRLSAHHDDVALVEHGFAAGVLPAKRLHRGQLGPLRRWGRHRRRPRQYVDYGARYHRPGGDASAPVGAAAHPDLGAGAGRTPRPPLVATPVPSGAPVAPGGAPGAGAPAPRAIVLARPVATVPPVAAGPTNGPDPGAGWLLAPAPPPPTPSAHDGADYTHAAQYQNIAQVVVSDVVPVDDDNIIAALRNGLPALERAAAAALADEDPDRVSPSSVYHPGLPDDQGSDDGSDVGDDV